MNEKKLDCPFCGCPNTGELQYPKHRYKIRCDACGAEGPDGNTIEEAREKWAVRK